MFRAFLCAWPFDLLHDRVSALLDRLRADVGLTGLAVRAAGAPHLQISASHEGPRCLRTRGGLYFQPETSRFSATRLSPSPSDWSGSRTALDRIIEEARIRDMAVRCVVSTTMIGRMAERHPAAATKNALGASSIRSLCLLNSDVEAFLVSLLGDLGGRESVGGVVLQDVHCAWMEAIEPTLAAAVPLPMTIRRLLSLCFCESCQHHADHVDIDGAAALRGVRVRIRQWLEGDGNESPTWEHIVREHGELGRWVEWQRDSVAALVVRLCDAFGRQVLIDPGDARQWLPTDPVPTKVDRCTWITPLTDEGSLARIASSAAVSREFQIQLVADAPQWSQKVVSLVTKAAEAGASAVTFDSPVLPGEAGMLTMRQAIRYARRTVSAP
jgi:hypothetical protein